MVTESRGATCPLWKEDSMEHNEMVKKLSEKANLSPEMAEDALTRANWDLLDAIILLEKEGKIAPLTSSMTTVENETGYVEVKPTASGKKSRTRGEKDAFSRLIDKCVELIKKSIDHSLIVRRNGKELLAVPVALMIIVVVAAFSAAAMALFIGLLFDCKYAVEKRD